MCVSACVCVCVYSWDFPGGSVVKSSPTNAGDAGGTDSIPGSGRSPGASHSSIDARIITWTEEPGGLQSMGLQRVRRDWARMHTLVYHVLCLFFCQVGCLYFLNFESSLCIMDVSPLSVIWMKIFPPILSLVNDFFAMQKKLLNIFM